MAPIPSPYFPEPIKVPNNVADGDYAAGVRFARLVGLAHLASLLGIVALTALWVRIGTPPFLERGNLDVHWLTVAALLALLAWSRRAPLILQGVIFLLFVLTFSAASALWVPYLWAEFPDLCSGFLWALGSAFIGVAAYNLFAGRDYSLVGEYVLAWLFTAISMTAFVLHRDATASEGFAIFVVVSGMLFYWVYDLAMVLRRRTASEPVAAVFDMYRDILNFVGYPIRVMRMQRRPKRLQPKW